MKHFTYDPDVDNYEVASLAEAWIETPRKIWALITSGVASLAEAWIETSSYKPRSHVSQVASLAEAWIETRIGLGSSCFLCRLPRGGVD